MVHSPNDANAPVLLHFAPLTPTFMNENETRIGIIFSPRPGGRRRWKRIIAYVDTLGIDYDYVRADGTADVERVAAMMTRNGYGTVIVAGGDAALNFAINGIMSTVSPLGHHPVLGIFPGGYGNDFARFWGIGTKNYRDTIAQLLQRRTRRIDVGRCVLTSDVSSPEKTGDAGEEQTIYFLNCINIGTAAGIMNLRHKTRAIFGLRTVSYLISALLLLFKRMDYKMEFKTAGETFSHRAMTLCIGSASGYGQTPNAVPYNGLLDISLVTAPKATQIFHGLWLLFTGRFLSHRGLSVWRTRKVTFTRTSRAPLSIDGRYLHLHAATLTADILPDEIDFLILP